jgi:putative Holliday junction resolvase
MAIHTPQALKARLPSGTRLLGLDLGEKTIGVAISDPSLTVASPIDTIRRTKFTEDVKQLAKMMAGREVGGIVIGLPINMDGTQGPRCQSVRHFAENLVKRAELLGLEPEIAFWDERLSTVAVQRLLISEADMTRNKRAQSVDKMAAAYILQGALDALNKKSPDPS